MRNFVIFTPCQMKLLGSVGCIRQKRNAYRVLLGKPEASNHLKDLVIDGRIILKWISKD
jgi:hypothetical protein